MVSNQKLSTKNHIHSLLLACLLSAFFIGCTKSRKLSTKVPTPQKKEAQQAEEEKPKNSDPKPEVVHTEPPKPSTTVAQNETILSPETPEAPEENTSPTKPSEVEAPSEDKPTEVATAPETQNPEPNTQPSPEPPKEDEGPSTEEDPIQEEDIDEDGNTQTPTEEPSEEEVTPEEPQPEPELPEFVENEKEEWGEEAEQLTETPIELPPIAEFLPGEEGLFATDKVINERAQVVLTGIDAEIFWLSFQYTPRKEEFVRGIGEDGQMTKLNVETQHLELADGSLKITCKKKYHFGFTIGFGTRCILQLDPKLKKSPENEFRQGKYKGTKVAVIKNSEDAWKLYTALSVIPSYLPGLDGEIVQRKAVTEQRVEFTSADGTAESLPKVQISCVSNTSRTAAMCEMGMSQGE